jgi:hypothetical protein
MREFRSAARFVAESARLGADLLRARNLRSETLFVGKAKQASPPAFRITKESSMNKIILMGSAALLGMSAPAWTQSSTPNAPSPDMSTPTPADSSMPAPEPAAPAPAAAPAAPAPSTATADQSTAPSTTAPAAQTASGTAPAGAVNPDAAAKVNADWAKFDKGGKGKLTPLEFGTFVLAAKGQDVTAQVEKSEHSKAANLPAVKVLNATSAEFAKADTDKDKAISPNELAAYLSA